MNRRTRAIGDEAPCQREQRERKRRDRTPHGHASQVRHPYERTRGTRAINHGLLPVGTGGRGAPTRSSSGPAWLTPVRPVVHDRFDPSENPGCGAVSASGANSGRLPLRATFVSASVIWPRSIFTLSHRIAGAPRCSRTPTNPASGRLLGSLRVSASTCRCVNPRRQAASQRWAAAAFEDENPSRARKAR